MFIPSSTNNNSQTQIVNLVDYPPEVLPIEIIGREISQWADSKTQVNLSLVSIKCRQYVLQTAQNRNTDRLDLICTKIKSILNSSKPFVEQTYNGLTCFFLGINRYSDAKEAFSKTNDPNIKSYRYKDLAEYLIQHDNNDETNRIFNEAITFAESRPDKDSELSPLTTLLIDYRCLIGAKYIIGRLDSAFERTQRSLQVAELQIEAKDLQGASETINNIKQMAETLPNTGIGPHRQYGYKIFEIIPKCYFLGMIALLKFHCHEEEEAHKLIELADQKANEETNDPLLLSPTFTRLADIYFQIGDKEQTLKILEKAQNQAQLIEDKMNSFHILLGISKIYKNYNEDSLSFNTLKEALVLTDSIEDIDSRFYAFRLILQLSTEIQITHHDMIDIISKIKEAVNREKNKLQEIEDENDSEDEECNPFDISLFHLVHAECQIKSHKNAFETTRLISNLDTQTECLVKIGSSFLENGLHDEGKKVLLQAISILKNQENPVVNTIEKAINLLAQNNFLEEALESALEVPRLYTRYHRILDLLRIENERENLEQSLFLLHHLPKLPDDDKKEYVTPILNVSKLMAKKSTHAERDSLSRAISHALELTDSAKSFFEPLPNHRHFLFDIARAKAKIGDFLEAQKVMVEVRESILSYIKEAQKQNPNDLMAPIKDKKSDLIETAKLQTSLYDFDGAMETIEILKDDPDAYIEALSQIGSVHPKF